MSPNIPDQVIEFFHNEKFIKIEKSCQTCAFGAMDEEQDPCATCFKISANGIHFSQWAFNPIYDTDDETTPTSSGMLPRQQRIGYVTVAEAVNTLKAYLQKDNFNHWYKLILQYIAELQKLQEDVLLPEPTSDMSNLEFSEWFKTLQKIVFDKAVEREEQKHNKLLKETMRPGDSLETHLSSDSDGSIMAYPSQIARHYSNYAQKINKINSLKAGILRTIIDKVLNKMSNTREITLPHPSAELADIEAALKQHGITGGRRR